MNLHHLICTLFAVASFQVWSFDIIAHRGASGYIPEHTLAAAALAHGQQADYIEQDLVLSKDQQLVVLHDIHLETVTNVESVFPTRHREDGRYYALDFTLDELKLLRVHERETAEQQNVFSGRYNGDGHFTIATFAEHITTIRSLNKTTGRNVGLYSEIKSPSWHRAQGYDISKVVVETLRQFNLDDVNAKIYIQCFDFNEIKRLRNEFKVEVKLVQLIAENSWQESPTDYDALKTPQGIKQVSQYVQGIGPWLGQITKGSAHGHTTDLADWVLAAQKRGLIIHPYTYRVDALPTGISAQQLLSLIINKWHFDGVFTDQVPPVKTFVAGQD